MRWTSRSRPGIDALASAWLIRRYIDPAAMFAFAALPATAIGDSGRRFDIGVADEDLTAFESMIRLHGLAQDPVILRMARIVRAATFDDEIDTDPAGLGLMMISVGALLAEPNDARLVERSEFLFECVLAWCRHDVRSP